MSIKTILIPALALALLACGPGQNASNAAPEASGASGGATQAISDAERNGVLSAMHMQADAQGLVENECGDKVTPGLTLADVGLGRTILVSMGGGASMASCYGDGPGLWLMQPNSSGYREIYSSRGGYMAILPSTHRGARDLAFAGPGFSHATYFYDGASYAPSGQEIADEAMANATVLPQ
jgi:hypothetical protein